MTLSKAIPLTGHGGPWGCDTSRWGEVRLSALRAGRPLPPRKIPGTHFCQTLSPPQGHSAAWRIRSIDKSNYIGNGTRDLPACSIVPQPTTLPKPPHTFLVLTKKPLQYLIWLRSFLRRLCATSFSILSSYSSIGHYMFRPNWPSSGVQVVMGKDSVAHCKPVFFPPIVVTSGCFAHVVYDRRSQWRRGLRHELSSLAWTLGSWVRIPLEAWMSVWVLCLFCPVCR
jgi:hypothetical protein